MGGQSTARVSRIVDRAYVQAARRETRAAFRNSIAALARGWGNEGPKGALATQRRNW